MPLSLHEDDLATAGSRLWSELARPRKEKVDIGIYAVGTVRRGSEDSGSGTLKGGRSQDYTG
jgi:hypothetical protein